MEIQSPNKHRRGFTRIELAVVLACVTLLGAMGLTVLGDNRERSERVVCSNNLRQIGYAFHMWASDHGGENPWWTPYMEGGSLMRTAPFNDPDPGAFKIPGITAPLITSWRNNAWFQFAFINQELRTPAILVCPSEQNRRRAQDFSTSQTNGYLGLNMRNNATSYVIGLHAMNQYPSSVLSGDRTLRPNGADGSCNANIGTANGIYRDGPGGPGWLPFLHNEAGNLLLNDGRVEELSNAGLANFLNTPGWPLSAPVIHYLSP